MENFRKVMSHVTLLAFPKQGQEHSDVIHTVIEPLALWQHRTYYSPYSTLSNNSLCISTSH